MILERGGGGVILKFPISSGRWDIELLLCVYWLDNAVILVHCCVLEISCIQGTKLYPVSCRTLSFWQWMSIILTHTQLALLSGPMFRGFTGQCCACQDTGDSQCAAHYWSITHECSDIVVTHVCAPIARMSCFVSLVRCFPQGGQGDGHLQAGTDPRGGTAPL